MCVSARVCLYVRACVCVCVNACEGGGERGVEERDREGGGGVPVCRLQQKIRGLLAGSMKNSKATMMAPVASLTYLYNTIHDHL